MFTNFNLKTFFKIALAASVLEDILFVGVLVNFVLK